MIENAKHTLVGLATLTIVLSPVAAAASGPGWALEDELVPSKDHTQFGWSVATDEDWLLAGAPADDEQGFASGSAHLFERDGTHWTHRIKLVGNETDEDDLFGDAVAVSGDVAVVGASNEEEVTEGKGSAYVFEHNGTTWVQRARLTPGDPEAERFGEAVDVTGDMILVGAPGHDGEGPEAGSAYIFQKAQTGWIQQTRLRGNDTDGNDEFGISVALSDRWAIVGAKGDESPGGEGSAYVYENEGAEWIQQSELTADDTGGSDRFGASASISGDRLVFGAPHDTDGEATGSAYTFQYDGTAWVQEDELLPLDGGADRLGESVAVSEDWAILGAKFGDGHGTAYLFQDAGDDWVHEEKVSASDGEQNDKFGSAVAISDARAAVGAPFERQGGETSGSVYTYGLDTDDDELSDAQEDEHGTDPTDPDSDGDFYGDGAEVACGSDPNDAKSVPLPTCTLPGRLLPADVPAEQA